jgi:hypothetical protein
MGPLFFTRLHFPAEMDAVVVSYRRTSWSRIITRLQFPQSCTLHFGPWTTSWRVKLLLKSCQWEHENHRGKGQPRYPAFPQHCSSARGKCGHRSWLVIEVMKLLHPWGRFFPASWLALVQGVTAFSAARSDSSDVNRGSLFYSVVVQFSCFLDCPGTTRPFSCCTLIRQKGSVLVNRMLRLPMEFICY